MHVTTSSLSIMLALMVTPERRDASQVMYAPIHPAQALLTRFTCWEKRIENLIEFFTQVQDFQRIHSRHYVALSALASQTFGEAERLREDGIIRIWKGLQEKTGALAIFYNGLSTAYNETVIRDLNMKLAEIRIFKGDLNRIRSKEAAKAGKRQGKFENAVKNLTKSLNQIGVSKQRDDPYVANRSKALLKPLYSNCRMSFASRKMGPKGQRPESSDIRYSSKMCRLRVQISAQDKGGIEYIHRHLAERIPERW